MSKILRLPPRLAVRGYGCALAALILSGCISHAPVEVKDGGPGRELDVSHIPDAVPRLEPRTRAGNTSPYTVLGRTYHLVEDTRDFQQRGYASWYGTKFHGKQTANGEIYDMYGMTAAHKTLPIPSYVRVTNRENGRSVIVRINDRGPFHEGRIIDLTYTAARKLGFADKGTAPVTLEYIDMVEPQLVDVPPVTVPSAADTPTASAKAPEAAAGAAGSAAAQAAPAPENSAGYRLPDNTFLQVGAFGSQAAAQALRARLHRLIDHPVRLETEPVGNLVRVRVGPFSDKLELMAVRQKLLDAQFSEPHVVYD